VPFFSASGKVYNIPDSLVSRFIEKNPTAIQGEYYHVGEKKYVIPPDKNDAFLARFPNAVPAVQPQTLQKDPSKLDLPQFNGKLPPQGEMRQADIKSGKRHIEIVRITD